VRNRSGGVLPGVAPSNAYPTADGTELLIAGNGDGVFARLCTAMRQPWLATDPRFATHRARGDNADELDAIVSVWTSRHARDALMAELAAHDVPHGIVYTATDMLDDPQYAAREMVQRLVSVEGVEMPVIGVVPKFSRTPGTIRTPGPELGADTDALLAAPEGTPA